MFLRVRLRSGYMRPDHTTRVKSEMTVTSHAMHHAIEKYIVSFIWCMVDDLELFL